MKDDIHRPGWSDVRSRLESVGVVHGIKRSGRDSGWLEEWDLGMGFPWSEKVWLRYRVVFLGMLFDYGFTKIGPNSSEGIPEYG